MSTRLETLLKDREDEYTRYKQFYVLVGTFNVNNRQAPDSARLEQWFTQVSSNDKTNESVVPDIITVGFQEIDTSGGAYLYDDKKKEDDWESLVKKTISSCYQDDNVQFELLNRVRLVGILLFVYVRSVHLPKCTLNSRSSVPTGFMGLAGNKGGVGIRFRFYETDICFINSHFASGDGQTQRRNNDYQTVESHMAFTDGPIYSFKDYFWYTGAATNPNVSASSTANWWKICDHDVIFWCGDLNYRISEPNERVRKAIEELSTVPLHEKDQLRVEMKLDRVFNGYYEPPIDFMPTYKFDIGSDYYDTSEKLRTPSWTDRILYRPKRPTVMNNNTDELESVQVIQYKCAKDIRFSDHRPVSGLYRVVIKYECDVKSSNRIRDELIRQFDRLENEAIPTIELEPRPPQIYFPHLRYLDRRTFSLFIKNVGEYPAICKFSPMFDYLTFSPSPPYVLNVKQEQHVTISYEAKGNMKPISEILILQVENGADAFITLDMTFDKGPFGLNLDQYPATYYDNDKKQYIYSIEPQLPSEHIVEAKTDPPVVYIALIDCLNQRDDFNLLNIFNNETQDSLDLIAIRDQIYANHFDFSKYSTAEISMIFLYLLQSLPRPLISFEIQDKIFSSNSKIDPSRPETMTEAVSIVIEQISAKERSLFSRFLLLLKQSWPTKEQLTKLAGNSRDMLNTSLDILALSIMHDHLDRNQRQAFLFACLDEEKTS